MEEESVLVDKVYTLLENQDINASLKRRNDNVDRVMKKILKLSQKERQDVLVKLLDLF